jgi:hypothetical protein
MNALMQTVQHWVDKGRGQGAAVAVPILVMLVLSMMVLPLAPWMLDTLFTLNIALALTIMMVAAYMKRALDFVAFPVVLLLTTLMRLALNVASTRVVLMEGHTGPGAAGERAAEVRRVGAVDHVVQRIRRRGRVDRLDRLPAGLLPSRAGAVRAVPAPVPHPASAGVR